MAAVGVASGCGDQQQQLPSAPEYHLVTGVSSGCDFTHINQLVNAYFTTPRQQVVRNLVSAMDAAVNFSTAAKGYGFDIMAHMDTVVSAGSPGDPTVGANLVDHLILCMYDPTTIDSASYPVTFPDTASFRIALTPALHGAFAVKPGSSTNTTDAAVVLSRPVSFPFSGVAPKSGTWADVVDGNTPARVLLYGRPGVTDQTYDWKSLPHNAVFDSIVVAVCVSASADQTALLNEQNLGLLPFVDVVDPHFLSPGISCSTSSIALGEAGPSRLARALTHIGASLFGPRTLWAAALSPGGLGGSTGGIRSEFGSEPVPSVNVAFVKQPSDAVINQPIQPFVTVNAYQPDGTPVGGVQVTLLAVTNNGTKVSPSGNVATTALVNVQGTTVALATFSNLRINKPGGYLLQIQPPPGTQVSGRSSAITIVTPFSNRFNEKSK
jgi:hypothetical protein